MQLLNSLIGWYFKNRAKKINYALEKADEIQLSTLMELIEQGKYTEFGSKYNFENIRNYEEFKQQVPTCSYEEIIPYIDRLMNGSKDLLWPGEINWFAKSSGTTNDKSKFIPVSFDTLENCHFEGGKDVLSMYVASNPETQIFSGKGLLIGGSHKVSSLNDSVFYGDLSAVLINHLPFWATMLKTPQLSIALMEHWDEKLDAMVEETMNENVTSISGVPTWTLVLFDRLLQKTGKKNISEIWPNLELYIHGGVNFNPYREQFKKYIPSPKMHYVETYNASEGFFGLQTDLKSTEMSLMSHYGIFYEFMPMSQAEKENPEILPLWKIEPNVNYALLITTNSGLWRYKIGDTLTFSSVKPYRFHLTGRTKLFINAFGEELIMENAENAIEFACAETGSNIRDYTAAPIFLTDPENAGHQWLIEFDTAPEEIERFTFLLDKKLQELNSDYEAKRQADLALKMPKVMAVPKGTFQLWLKSKGKLGGQHKVPRLSNDRIIVEQVLAILSQQST